MCELEEIVMVLVVRSDGSECYEPLRDMLTNPPPDAWIKRESRRIVAERV